MHWTYELQLSKVDENGEAQGIPKEHKISGLNLTITGLIPDSVYVVKVRARSEAGFGPWSKGFIGRTLKQGLFLVCSGCKVVIFIHFLKRYSEKKM